MSFLTPTASNVVPIANVAPANAANGAASVAPSTNS